MTETPDQDRGAMARLAAGEDLALNEIMDRWKARVIAFLFRLVGNESSALELAEETFERLYQGRRKFRPDAKFSSWLFGIAANLGRNHLRWQGRHPTLPLDAADAVTMEGDPHQAAESREREEAVNKAIARLPPDLREALVLCEYEHLSQAEVAEIAGCSVKAVERRQSHAREILRKDLSRYLRPG
jgi:RNA polymerase sigma-70 factor, ECF subfamily